jgi:hypothetical protein
MCSCRLSSSASSSISSSFLLLPNDDNFDLELHSLISEEGLSDLPYECKESDVLQLVGCLLSLVSPLPTHVDDKIYYQSSGDDAGAQAGGGVGVGGVTPRPPMKHLRT